MEIEEEEIDEEETEWAKELFGIIRSKDYKEQRTITNMHPKETDLDRVTSMTDEERDKYWRKIKRYNTTLTAMKIYYSLHKNLMV